MHFHRDRTLGRTVTRGVHDVYRDRTPQFVRIVIAAVGLRMRLISLEFVTVVHRPAVCTLRRAGHRHGNAVHRNRRRFRLAELTVLNLQLNLLLAIAKRNHAVFAVQIHRERARAGNAVFRMLLGTAVKRAFVHHDVGVTSGRLSDVYRGNFTVAIDRDRQMGIGTVAFTISDRIAEADTCRLTTGQTRVRLGRKHIAAVGIQRGNTVLRIYRVHAVRYRIGTVRAAFLVRIAAQIPGHTGTAVGTETVRLARAVSIRKDIATGAGILRHAVHVVIGHRPVVHHVHGDGRTAAVTVRIRHRHRQVMGDLRIRSGIALVVFRGVPVECVIEVQPARGRIIAGHGQGTFIRGNRVARERAVFKHGHVADDNGRHAVRGVDDQGSSGRDRSVGRAGSRAIGKAGFMDRHHFRSRIAIERSHSHAVIHPAIALIPGTGLHRVCGKLYTAVEADVQATQMVDAIQQVTAAIFVITAAARGTAAGSGTGSGHQVFAKGREEVLPADLHAVHLERGHLFLGIGGVETLQLDGSAILKGQDKIVAAAGQRRGIRRKIEDEAPVRSAGDGLCGTSNRLGKTDIGHEGPPEKVVY